MCDVSTLVLGVIAVVGATASYMGQQQTAKSQYRFAKAQAKEGERLAHENFRLQNEAESRLREQENEESSRQAIEVQREYAQARSTARVAAGEAGVAGLSVDALLAEFDSQESEELGMIDKNNKWAAEQSGLRRRGFQAQGNQNISRTRFAPINKPSTAVYAAQLAGIGTNTYTSYRRSQ